MLIAVLIRWSMAVWVDVFGFDQCPYQKFWVSHQVHKKIPRYKRPNLYKETNRSRVLNIGQEVLFLRPMPAGVYLPAISFLSSRYTACRGSCHL